MPGRHFSRKPQNSQKLTKSIFPGVPSVSRSPTNPLCIEIISPSATVGRMARVERPTVQPNLRPVPALLHVSLRRVVALLAERLKRPQPKLVHVAMMRLDVIADFRRSDDAALETELAQWVHEKLMPSD